MLVLSDKIKHIEESQTLALSGKAKRMKDSGIDVVSLTAGEPDFPTPRHIKDAAITAIENNFTKYTQNAGSPDLIDAIVRKFTHENNLFFGHNQILVSAGAKQSIFNVLQAICNKGDEVLFFSPYWVSYPEIVKLADAIPVPVPTSIANNFKPDIEQLRKAITPKTKALIINSPNNPSGVVFSQDDMESIGSIVKDANIFVIADEIYEKVVYDSNRHFSIGSIKSLRDNAITVNGVSKAFSMTGWRVGYAGGPAAVIEAAAKVQTQVTSNANSIAQKATVTALTVPTPDLQTMVSAFKERRDVVYKHLSAMTDVRVALPGGAFYFFFDVSKLYGRKFQNHVMRNSADMGTYLLDHHHVATVPGVAFGDDSCLRISYACSLPELEKGLERIKTGFEMLS
ncbi:MAG: pyridoxal phosphate-dependent aminotransferase [Bacteroidetes bacterium]|nr:pyridoxal phosphate-dependent aminotransferase [Bacteroidota bacterium]MCW5895969.1 pyridoxal phosphate-dependent aminotransferase [Bacteroidota bacterium]